MCEFLEYPRCITTERTQVVGGTVNVSEHCFYKFPCTMIILNKKVPYLHESMFQQYKEAHTVNHEK